MFNIYNANTLDMSQLKICFLMGKISKEEIIEMIRKQLVGSMKTGKVFIFILGKTLPDFH